MIIFPLIDDFPFQLGGDFIRPISRGNHNPVMDSHLLEGESYNALAVSTNRAARRSPNCYCREEKQMNRAVQWR